MYIYIYIYIYIHTYTDTLAYIYTQTHTSDPLLLRCLSFFRRGNQHTQGLEFCRDFLPRSELALFFLDRFALYAYHTSRKPCDFDGFQWRASGLCCVVCTYACVCTYDIPVYVCVCI